MLEAGRIGRNERLSCKSVREFQERFASGEFSQDGIRESGESYFDKMVQAGWYDWFCEDWELVHRLKHIGRIVCKVEEGGKVDLDGMRVWFKNNCPASDHPLYDDIRFSTEEGNVWVISLFDERCERQYSVARVSGDDVDMDYFASDSDVELIEWLNTPNDPEPDKLCWERIMEDVAAEQLRLERICERIETELGKRKGLDSWDEDKRMLDKMRVDVGAASGCLARMLQRRP